MILTVNGQPSTVNGSLINGLYVITASNNEKDRSHSDVCLAALQGGARIIQYRQKGNDYEGSLKEALQLKELCLEYKALFIVNDQAHLAIDVDADGLHLGQGDLDISEARKLFPNKIIGLSTHSLNEAERAQSLNLDYISVGPIFYTESKTDAAAPIGLQILSEVKKNSDVPVIAIGGINKENAPSVLGAGADAIAVISAISSADDMVKATKELYEFTSKY